MDQGSATEIMYPDLYKGMNLKVKDLTPYSSPLVSFKGKIIILKGQVRLPVQTGSEVVEVDFIVMDAYSPYTAIVAKPWLHTLGSVSSTLHQKVKYPSESQIKEILGDQSLARQCIGLSNPPAHPPNPPNPPVPDRRSPDPTAPRVGHGSRFPKPDAGGSVSSSHVENP